MSSAHNPFFGGTHADALSMIPFAAIAVGLYAVGARDARQEPTAG